MATYSISIEFTVNSKNDDKAQEMAERIAAYVQQEKMATDASIIDIEVLESEEDLPDELDFDEDYE